MQCPPTKWTPDHQLSPPLTFNFKTITIDPRSRRSPGVQTSPTNIIFTKSQNQKTNITLGAAEALECTAGTNIGDKLANAFSSCFGSMAGMRSCVFAFVNIVTFYHHR